MKFQEFMDKFGSKGGTKITSSSINEAKKAGISSSDLNKFIDKAGNKGIKVGGSVKPSESQSGKYLSGGSGSSGGGSGSSGGPYSGLDLDLAAYDHMAATDFKYQDALNQAGYNSNQIIAGIRSDADKYVADAYAGAQMYGADAQVEIAGITSSAEERWRKYLADQQRAGAENVATIQGEYDLSLQNIVTAGLKDVEKIRGEYGLESDKLRGEYGLEGERIKGDAARDVASRQKDAQIFGSLMSGFWS